ncbi:hypothetical protein AVEN_30962-1, partial [Araneus ventricosus]
VHYSAASSSTRSHSHNPCPPIHLLGLESTRMDGEESKPSPGSILVDSGESVDVGHGHGND